MTVTTVHRLVTLSLIVSLLVASAPLAKNINSATSEKLLNLEYSYRGLEVAEVTIVNEKTNPDGSTTADFIVENKTSVAYLVRFIVEGGNITGADFERTKRFVDKNVPFPLLGKSKFKLGSLTWSPGTKLRLELDRMGANPKEALFAMTMNFATISWLFLLGEYLPTTEGEFYNQLLEATPLFFEQIDQRYELTVELGVFYSQVQNGRLFDAAETFGSIVEKVPFIFNAYLSKWTPLRLSDEDVSKLGKVLKNIVKLIDRAKIVLVALDWMTKPTYATITISAPSSATASSAPSDVVLIIDRSGSMQGAGITAAKLAARLMVDLLRDGDRVSVVSFSTSARIELPMITLNAQTRPNAYFYINQIMTDGNTSIGAGLQLGLQQILNHGISGRNRGIVLLSDGVQNTPPVVNEILPNVVASKTPVYTIGLGAAAQDAVLREIAEQTNGLYSFAPASSDLVGIYNRISGQLTGRQLVISSLSTVNRGAINRHPVLIDSNDVVFSVAWNDISAQIDLSLTSPTGNRIAPSQVVTPYASSQVIESPGYVIYRVTDAEAGLWEMIVSAPSGSAQPTSIAYTFAAAVVSDIKMEAQATPTILPPLSSFTVSAMLYSNDGAARGNTVSIIDTATSVVAPVADNGLDGDSVANDGVYTTVLISPELPGTYSYVIRADGQDFSRQEEFTITVDAYTQLISDVAVVIGGPERAFVNTPTVYNGYIINTGPQNTLPISVYFSTDSKNKLVSSSLGAPTISGGQYKWNIPNVAPNAVVSFTVTTIITDSTSYDKQSITQLRVEPNNVVRDLILENNTSSVIAIVSPNKNNLPLIASGGSGNPTITPAPTNTVIPTPSSTSTSTSTTLPSSTPISTSTNTPTATSTNTPTTTPTGDRAPTATMSILGNGLIVAGSTRSFEVRMNASEPTKWNAPAFTSNCSLTGLPSGFATESQIEHTVSTIIYIPPDVARKECVVQGVITTYGSQFPTTSFNISLRFAVFGPELMIVPSPLWSNSSSIQIAGGCMWAKGFVNGAERELKICSDTPALPLEWNDTIKEVYALCDPSIAPITVKLWLDTNFSGQNWSHSFCSTPPGDNPSSPPFSQVNIAPVANGPLDHLASPLSGNQVFAGVPFVLLSGDKAVFQSSHNLRTNQPNDVVFEASVYNPVVVHLLINGGYVDVEFKNQQIGDIILYFADGRHRNIPIIAWEDIREGWALVGDPKSIPLTPSSANKVWRNVYQEVQLRGGLNAYGYIDMLSVTLEPEYRNTKLIAIRISDRSDTLVNSANPSVGIAGITIEAAP